MLQNSTAKTLYYEYAENMPIIDYHCHLDAQEIAVDKRFQNITEIWLGGDHYKWRAMRINGVEERFITGDASDKEKFYKWAETIPCCIGNPLYHWTHLELKRYFGIDCQLSMDTAKSIWEQCNSVINKDDFSARQLIKRSNVQTVCTTDSPLESLEFHRQIAKDDAFDVRVLPSMRLDIAVNFDNVLFTDWIEKLETVSETPINCYSEYLMALSKRIDNFDKAGCRISDIAFESIEYCDCTEKDANDIFSKVLKGDLISTEEKEKLRIFTTIFLSREFARFGWTMQLHIGALRNNNERLFKLLGPDTGFDSIGDATFAKGLVKLLDALEKTGELPKTVLYCLNPRDNDVLATIMGCFQGDGVAGKIQFGSGWWFNDQKDGMEKQMISYANMSLLSRFIGMTTDSRSFLSYIRHEYFRRILCNLLGEWVDTGLAPNDTGLLGNIVKNICFNNANSYFKI